MSPMMYVVKKASERGPSRFLLSPVDGAAGESGPVEKLAGKVLRDRGAVPLSIFHEHAIATPPVLAYVPGSPRTKMFSRSWCKAL